MERKDAAGTDFRRHLSPAVPADKRHYRVQSGRRALPAVDGWRGSSSRSGPLARSRPGRGCLDPLCDHRRLDAPCASCGTTAELAVPAVIGVQADSYASYAFGASLMTLPLALKSSRFISADLKSALLPRPPRRAVFDLVAYVSGETSPICGAPVVSDVVHVDPRTVWSNCNPCRSTPSHSTNSMTVRRLALNENDRAARRQPPQPARTPTGSPCHELEGVVWFTHGEDAWLRNSSAHGPNRSGQWLMSKPPARQCHGGRGRSTEIQLVTRRPSRQSSAFARRARRVELGVIRASALSSPEQSLPHPNCGTP
jgi:hypothetical protein